MNPLPCFWPCWSGFVHKEGEHCGRGLWETEARNNTMIFETVFENDVSLYCTMVF